MHVCHWFGTLAECREPQKCRTCIEKAVIRQQTDGYWSVFIGGKLVISDESYGVASNVADAYNHPARPVGTEAAEIADRYRK